MFGQPFGSAAGGIASKNPRETWSHLSDPSATAVLVDVREAWEFSMGHAKGAKNIPLSQLQRRVAEIPRDADVLIICQSGNRSMQAARFLQAQGISRVVNVSGGTSVWQMHGLPMER